MNDKRILVVDDETDLLEMVKSIFTRAGFTQILTASSGEAALKMCEEQEPDMMILDVMMPGIFIFKTSFIYPFYLYFIMPARGHKCCERLVNPVPNLRVILARSGKKRAGRQAPQRKPAALVLLCHQLGELPQHL